MFTRGFGEVITDILTVNPALAELPSASSILDASNYTFQAVTFGKDADGFNYHAHTIYFTSAIDGDINSGVSSYNYDSSENEAVILVNWASDLPSGASSYIHSGIYTYFSSTYSSLPVYPDVYDTRLDRGNTIPIGLSSYSNISSISNIGHYLNPAIDPTLSSVWNVLGGFPPHRTVDLPKLYYFQKDNEPSDNTMTGALDVVELSSTINKNGLMDKDGYLIACLNTLSENHTIGSQAAALSGSFLFSGANFTPSSGGFKLATVLQKGDAACMVAFGGIRHIGVYCLDLQSMLESGLTPPYSWNALNNNRKYKLVAKTTLWDNLMYNVDSTVNIGGTDYDQSGLLNQLARNEIVGLPGTPPVSNGGPTINLNFDFK